MRRDGEATTPCSNDRYRQIRQTSIVATQS